MCTFFFTFIFKNKFTHTALMDSCYSAALQCFSSAALFVFFRNRTLAMNPLLISMSFWTIRLPGRRSRRHKLTLSSTTFVEDSHLVLCRTGVSAPLSHSLCICFNLAFTQEIQHVNWLDVNDLLFDQPILQAALILYYPLSN